MGFTPDIEEWLERNGYKHHCFISWPHTANKELTNCAKHIKEGISNTLAALINTPRVFLDETNLTAGDVWPEILRRDLCGSVTMVAILAPMYYHPAHQWCGVEWAAMDLLSKQRLPGAPLRTIIPVVVRRSEKVPAALSGLKCIDVSGVVTSSDYYFRKNEFRAKIEEIVKKIESVAEAIAQQGSRAGCEQFKFPEKSAFSDYIYTPQSFPFRT